MATIAPKKSEAQVFKKKFGARDYLETYYPHDADAKQLFAAFKKVQKAYDKKGRIHIQKTVKSTGMSPETIENLVIMDFQKTVLKHLAQKHPKGNATLLEVGGGPTIYQHIAPSLAVGHIVHSEFLEKNRDEVHKWIKETEAAYDWDAYFDLMKMMLAKDAGYQKLLSTHAASKDKSTRAHARFVRRILGNARLALYKERVRRCLKGGTAFGDLFHPNLGWKTKVTREWHLDAVVSNFAAESATADPKKWEKGLTNIMSFLKPGGLIAVAAIRNAKWYQVGAERIPSMSIDEKDLARMCKKEGFTILESKVLKGSPQKEVGYDGMVFMLAEKA